MNLSSKRAIRALFKQYKIRPSKKLGQNFLIDKKVVNKFIKAAALGSKDEVLEIGPGIGTLTQEIAKKAKRVIVVEKDPQMVEILKKTLREFKNIEIIQGDILKTDVSGFRFQVSGKYKVIGNLPFFLMAPVIRKFLETQRQPKEMIFFVQKEVGQKICASPPQMSLLAISVHFYAQPKIVSFFSKKSFWPQPNVDAAIIKIEPRIKNSELRINKDLFFRVVKVGFSHPRKQLVNNLSKGLKIDKEKVRTWLLKNGLQPNQRAETLKAADWLKLAKSLK